MIRKIFYKEEYGFFGLNTRFHEFRKLYFSKMYLLYILLA